MQSQERPINPFSDHLLRAGVKREVAFNDVDRRDRRADANPAKSARRGSDKCSATCPYPRSHPGECLEKRA